MASIILKGSDEDWIVAISTEEGTILPGGTLTTLLHIAGDVTNILDQTPRFSQSGYSISLEIPGTIGSCNATIKLRSIPKKKKKKSPSITDKS